MSQAQIDGRQLKNVTGVSAGNLYYVSTYKFTALAPGQTLTASTPATVTLSPFPSGISATLSPNKHYLYITDAIGGNEAVLITATNGTSTVTFTPASSHTAANWTISSSSGGLQETINVVGALATPVGRLSVNLVCSLHQQVWFPANGAAVTLDGLSSWWPNQITRASDYPNGDMLLAPSGGQVTLVNLGISGYAAGTQTSGACLHLQTYNTIANCFIQDGYSQIIFDACSANYSNNFISAGSHGVTSILIENGCTDVSMNGGQLFSRMAAGCTGIKITSGDGITVNGIDGGGGDFWLRAEAASGKYVANVAITNNILDGALSAIIKIASTGGGATGMGGIVIAGNSFLGDGNYPIGLDLAYSQPSGQLADMAITGNTFSYFTSFAIVMGITSDTTPNWSITGNTIDGAGGGATCDGIYTNGVKDVSLANNVIGSCGRYGINLNYTNVSKTRITGGSVLNCGTGAIIVAGGPPLELLIANVGGVDAALNSVNVASSISSGYSYLTVLGGTAGTIDTITGGWAYRRICLMNNSSGSVTLSTSGNIAVSHTVAQYASVYLICIDTGGGLKWY
jgi:hypothetical protein